MAQYFHPLLPNETYHLFNRAIGNEKIFLNEENYRFFFQKMKLYLTPVADLYAYSLLPNHFHLLIRIKDEESIKKYFTATKKKEFNDNEDVLSEFVMQQISNWFNSYTKSFNKMYERKGALFMDFVKRSIVNMATDFSSYIFYIHKNAVHHGITKKMGEWKYDSYNSIITNKPTLLLRSEIIEWFGSTQEFIKFHQQPVTIKPIRFLETL